MHKQRTQSQITSTLPSRLQADILRAISLKIREATIQRSYRRKDTESRRHACTRVLSSIFSSSGLVQGFLDLSSTVLKTVQRFWNDTMVLKIIQWFWILVQRFWKWHNGFENSTTVLKTVQRFWKRYKGFENGTTVLKTVQWFWKWYNGFENGTTVLKKSRMYETQNPEIEKLENCTFQDCFFLSYYWRELLKSLVNQR